MSEVIIWIPIEQKVVVEKDNYKKGTSEVK